MYPLSNYLATGVGVGHSVVPLWNVSEPGPGAGGCDGEKAVVDTPASQGRYTRYSGTHMVSDISCF